MNKEKLFRLARWSLGVVFIAASGYKLWSPDSFAHQIYNYKILPLFLINPMALLLPPLQLVCGAALLAGRWTKGAAMVALVMLVAFQAAVASALIRGLNISCGCFQAGGSEATWWTFGRDFLFLLLAGVTCFDVFRRRRVE